MTTYISRASASRIKGVVNKYRLYASNLSAISSLGKVQVVKLTGKYVSSECKKQLVSTCFAQRCLCYPRFGAFLVGVVFSCQKLKENTLEGLGICISHAKSGYAEVKI